MNSKISQHTYWRSGVVLKERNNLALIRADKEDKRITIQVKGTEATRRTFLSAIRSQFDEIHKTIRLDISEYLLYQEHPPILLNYEHLLSAEEAGKRDWFIPQLKRDVNLRELLDGVEEIQERQPDRFNRQLDQQLDRPLDRQSSDRQASSRSPQPEPQPQNQVFISYAWDKGESEEIANQIDQHFQTQGITIIRDIRDLKFGDSAKKFMQWLGQGKCIITVISDKYLKSRNCMYELVQISENARSNEALRDRIFPIVLSSAKIYDPRDRIQYISYWQNECEALNTEIQKLGNLTNTSELQKDLNAYAKFREIIDNLSKLLSDMKSINLDMERNDVTLSDRLPELFASVSHKLSKDKS
jgi:hypothetical protein